MLPLNDSTFERFQVFIEREGHEVDRSGEIVTIDGKPASTYTVGRDYCFGMGDNRDNSLDSRAPMEIGVGFVPAENLVGKAQVILLSWDPAASLFKPWTWVLDARPSRFFNVLQ